MIINDNQIKDILDWLDSAKKQEWITDPDISREKENNYYKFKQDRFNFIRPHSFHLTIKMSRILRECAEIMTLASFRFNDTAQKFPGQSHKVFVCSIDNNDNDKLREYLQSKCNASDYCGYIEIGSLPFKEDGLIKKNWWWLNTLIILIMVPLMSNALTCYVNHVSHIEVDKTQANNSTKSMNATR